MFTEANHLELFILISVVLANTFLAFLVYKNNPKSVTNKIFIALSGVTSLWVIFMYAAVSTFFFSHVLLITRLTMFLAIPQIFLFYLLAETLPNNKFSMKKKYLVYLVIEALFLMAFTLTPYVFEGVEIINGVPNQIPGVGIIVFAVVVVSFSAGTLLALIKKMKNSFGITLQQIRFVLLGIVLMLGLIIATILFPMMFFQNDAFVPLTPIYVLLFLGTTAYAIIKHQFLDVRLVLVRAISYTVLIFSLAALYAGMMLFVATQFFEFTFDRRFLILAIVLTTFIALSFGTLSKNVKRITDKVFFKDDYDANKLLAQLTQVMARTIDLDRMTNAILNILVKNMRVSRAAFLILEEHKLIDIKRVCVEGEPYHLNSEEFEILREYVYKDLKQNREAFVFRDMEEGKYKKVFRNVGISIAIPIHVKKDCVAILLLDKKRSGEIYTQQNINFLGIFAAEAGIAIQNAKSYEQIKKFSEELEGRVQQRTKELKEAQKRELKKAQDVSRLKDEFVFIATHELRAPITAIRLFLEMMPTKADYFPKDIQEKLDSIAQASNHLNQLINDLLEIARSEAGSMKIVVEPIDIMDLIQKQVKELSSSASKKKLTIVINSVEKPPNVMADKKKITEVITNLISNAIKYNREAGTISIGVLENDKNVLVEVKDTGFGIPKDQQGKIFQKFFRASSKDTLNVLGTGLGLFISRMLVEKMGGTIHFTSVENEGTTIAFSLPKA